MEQSAVDQALKQQGLRIEDGTKGFDRDFSLDVDEGQDEQEELDDILAKLTGKKVEAAREEIEAWQSVYEEALENLSAAIVDIDRIVPNPDQPRKYFDSEKIERMAATIKDRGRPTNPIIVMPYGDNFKILSGERRWRGLKGLGVKRALIIIVKNPGDAVDILEESIVANLHQEKLNIVETAFGFKDLMEKRGWSQAELSRHMGKEHSEITNIFRVFRLHEDFQAMLLFEKVQPGAILHLGTYAMNVQKNLFNDLMEEVEGKHNGKMPHPNIVAKVLRRLAEGQGIKPLKPKRGKRISTHAEMVLRSINKVIQKLAKELNDLSPIGNEALRTAKDPKAFNILSALGQIEEDIHDVRIELEEKLNI